MCKTDRHFCPRWNLNFIKWKNQIFETKSNRKTVLRYLLEYMKQKSGIKMLIINQRTQTGFLKNLWISKHILNFGNYLLWSDNHFGWPRQNKHVWAVPLTSINSFWYVYLIILQIGVTAHSLFLFFLSFNYPDTHDTFAAGKQASSA